MDRSGRAGELYDATIAAAWRLACCLTASPAEAEDLVAAAYREALADDVPVGVSPTAWVLGRVHALADRPRVPPLEPAA